jgi:hypothetical protein
VVTIVVPLDNVLAFLVHQGHVCSSFEVAPIQLSSPIQGPVTEVRWR